MTEASASVCLMLATAQAFPKMYLEKIRYNVIVHKI